MRVVGTVLFALASGGLLSACDSGSPASLEFVDVAPAQPRLGDIATVRFKAIDGRGVPQAGVTVRFRLQSEQGGVTLTPASALTNRGDGVASAQIVSAGRAASVVVIATAGDKEVQSPPITFAGAGPSARQFTFQCGSIAGDASGGVHAIGAFDETRHLISGVKVDCFAHLADRNGDATSGVLVSFLSEAGTIGPTAVSGENGNAGIQHHTSYPLPKDVAPGAFSWKPTEDDTHTGEFIAPLWMHPFSWVANPVSQYDDPPSLQEPRRADPIRPGVVLNPRDNLVTLIAFTTGEEAFDDINNNGGFDEGEPFEDLTEPFVDSDDNGTWDPDERWVDTNGNGRWDGKDGTYNASTLIWVQERILWTGIPHTLDFGGPEPVFRLIEPKTPPLIPHFGYVDALFLIADPWFNSMAQNGDGDGCSTVSPEEKPIVTSLPQTFAGGKRLTYPAVQVVAFNLRDAHDPAADPPQPKFVPPAAFYVPITCTTTASPNSGHVVKLVVPGVTGTVE